MIKSFVAGLLRVFREEKKKHANWKFRRKVPFGLTWIELVYRKSQVYLKQTDSESSKDEDPTYKQQLCHCAVLLEMWKICL